MNKDITRINWLTSRLSHRVPKKTSQTSSLNCLQQMKSATLKMFPPIIKIWNSGFSWAKHRVGKKQKEFFCLFRTNHKNEIASLYSASSDDELSDNDKTWITHFVSFLKRIKDFDWSNSFADLPKDGNNKKVSFYFGWEMKRLKKPFTLHKNEGQALAEQPSQLLCNGPLGTCNH